MSNEELALAIQAGSKDAAGALWEQVKRLITKLCSRYFPLCQSHGCEADDLIQCCYFAMLDAARAYNPDKELKFTSYLEYHIQRHCLDALGLRKRNQPLLLSIDAPVKSTEDLAVADTLADPNAAQSLENVDQALWLESLRKELNKGLAQLPPDQSDILQQRYYDGLTLKQVAERRGWFPQRVHVCEHKALRAMRRSKLYQEYRDYIISRSMELSGLGFFRAAGYSSVEWAVEKMNKARLDDVPKSNAPLQLSTYADNQGY